MATGEWKNQSPINFKVITLKGKKRIRFYEDKQGVKRLVMEVVGEEINMRDKKEGTGSAHFVLPSRKQYKMRTSHFVLFLEWNFSFNDS